MQIYCDSFSGMLPENCSNEIKPAEQSQVIQLSILVDVKPIWLPTMLTFWNYSRSYSRSLELYDQLDIWMAKYFHTRCLCWKSNKIGAQKTFSKHSVSIYGLNRTTTSPKFIAKPLNVHPIFYPIVNFTDWWCCSMRYISSN